MPGRQKGMACESPTLVAADGVRGVVLMNLFIIDIVIISYPDPDPPPDQAGAREPGADTDRQTEVGHGTHLPPVQTITQGDPSLRMQRRGRMSRAGCGSGPQPWFRRGRRPFRQPRGLSERRRAVLATLRCLAHWRSSRWRSCGHKPAKQVVTGERGAAAPSFVRSTCDKTLHLGATYAAGNGRPLAGLRPRLRRSAGRGRARDTFRHPTGALACA